MDSVKRVKLFGDWDKTSMEMVDLLRSRTTGMIDNYYLDMEFVDKDYTHAVVFNYPREEIECPAENVIGLILEPPEILDYHMPDRIRGEVPGVGRMYSFCGWNGYDIADSLGFATVSPATDDIMPYQKPKRAMMIVSNKVITRYHHMRQAVYARLLQTDLEIDFYGRGMNNPDPRCKGEIPSYGKAEIFKDYAMCIDFENAPGCITDKFFDPTLCNTFPISNAISGKLHLDGYFWISLNEDTNFIVEQIHGAIAVPQVELIKRTTYLLYNKQEILQGSMNLTRWIWERLNECQ